MRVARQYFVSGRVQGVGFRYFVADAASRENISGWVRNLPDGRVEISADGDAEARAAVVDEVAIEERQPGEGRRGFFIR
jgi:acylphosphatase